MIQRSAVVAGGPVLSDMAYGTWRMLSGGTTAQDVNARLNCCLDLGITTIDTAEIYGGYQVEAMLGAALALSPGLRDKLEIVTKAGIYVPTAAFPDRPNAFYDATGRQLQASVDRSLRLLGTDRVDVFLVHRPDWLTGIDDTAAGLNALVAAGKIGHAGVSNYSATQFAALASRMQTGLVTNQVEFSLLHMDPIHDGTFDQCQQGSLRPMAWSPLAGGRLVADGEAAGRIRAAAAGLSDKYGGASVDQLAYAWIMAHPSRPIPVIGTNRAERIASAAAAHAIAIERADWFALWIAARGHGIP